MTEAPGGEKKPSSFGTISKRIKKKATNLLGKHDSADGPAATEEGGGAEKRSLSGDAINQKHTAMSGLVGISSRRKQSLPTPPEGRDLKKKKSLTNIHKTLPKKFGRSRKPEDGAGAGEGDPQQQE